MANDSKILIDNYCQPLFDRSTYFAVSHTSAYCNFINVRKWNYYLGPVLPITCTAVTVFVSTETILLLIIHHNNNNVLLLLRTMIDAKQ